MADVECITKKRGGRPGVKPGTCGIYVIRNTANGKVYVGSSLNIAGRWTHHRTALASGTHKNPHLQSAYKKYGNPCFSFEIIELCLEFSVFAREVFWCKKLKANRREFGYNIRNPELRGRLTDEHRRNISRSLMGRAGVVRSPEGIASYIKKMSGPGNPMYGRPSPNKGKSISPETRKKCSDSLKLAWKLRRIRFPEVSSETRIKLGAASKKAWASRKNEQRNKMISAMNNANLYHQKKKNAGELIG